jgi:hypothetical protein
MLVIVLRAFSDSLLALDTAPKAIGVALLGAFVTALIVWRSRGVEELKKHVLENVIIVFAGALGTWALVFAVILLRTPTKVLSEANANLNNVIVEKRQLNVNVDSQTREIEQLKSELADSKQKFEAVEMSEAPDSLRRRTFKLADEFTMYLAGMLDNKNKPPDASPNSADPNPSEERKKEIQASQAYYRGIEDYYAKHFRDRFVGIVKEYENRGVRTGYLANDFAQRVPYIPQLGSVMDGLDEISRFRDLAYHVDARDHLIAF